MEKNKAVEVYEDALSAGSGGYLLEQKDDDILQISVGNLPPSKSVILTITYVQELVMKDKESLSFSIPFALYGSFDVTPDVYVSIEMPFPILQVSIFPQIGNPTYTQSDRRNTAILHLPPGRTRNHEDISILVKLGPELGRPRMWAEKWTPDPLPAGGDPLAVMLAFSPNIDQSAPEEEVVFMLDCSGSMMGDPMQQLAYTMYHALKLLPSSAIFNIVCFGTSHTFLFPNSVHPTFENLFAARKLISKLPDLGGTSLLQPLQAIYKSTAGKKHHIILLTDGQVENTGACVAGVKQNPNCVLTTIGIGNVDRKLVKDLAEAGRGKCEVISSQNITNMENIMAELLKWTLPPAFDQVDIVWYDPEGDVCHRVKKTPEKLPPMYAGDLYRIYALISDSSVQIFRAQIQAVGKAGKFSMDIELKTRGGETETRGTLVHVLAAKQLIREIEEGAFREIMDSKQQEKEIVRLGVTYNLASKFTSFVAVEERSSPSFESMEAIDINKAFILKPRPPPYQRQQISATERYLTAVTTKTCNVHGEEMIVTSTTPFEQKTFSSKSDWRKRAIAATNLHHSLKNVFVPYNCSSNSGFTYVLPKNLLKRFVIIADLRTQIAGYLYGVSSQNKPKTKEIKAIVLPPQWGTTTKVYLPTQLPSQSHESLQGLEPLGWIHTQPRAPDLPTQDIITHALIADCHPEWHRAQTVVITVAFNSSSCSLSAYSLTDEGFVWGKTANEHSCPDASQKLYEKVPLVLADNYLGFFMVPDLGPWNYNFMGVKYHTNMKYGIKLDNPKPFYDESHRPVHFQNWTQSGATDDEMENGNDYFG
eukprot:Phypoly_transcript_02377.p1 GENE.Phypoly_transcript_02377~~Phypoly_transcript_02377.p1  ORF type:complete len:896 (+),score=129.81 Phypoly_transcript_02377:235-2688(+)